MRDRDDRARLIEAGEGTLDQLLGHRVDRARRLVQHHEIGVDRDGAGKRDELGLAGGEVRPAVRHLEAVAARERPDERGRLHLARRPLRRGRLQPAQGDVELDGAMEQEHVLVHDGHHAPDPVRVERGDLFPVQTDGALVASVGAGDQADDRRLAGAGRPHDRDRLTSPDLEVDPPQHLRLVRGVPKPDTLEVEALESRRRDRFRVPAPRLRQLRRFRRIGGFGEETPDVVERPEGPLQDRELLGELAHRNEEALDVLHEGDEHADGHGPREQGARRVPEDHRQAEARQPFDERIEHRVVEVGGVLRRVEAAVAPLEGGEHLRLRRVELHRLDPGEAFLEISGRFRERPPRPEKGGPHPALEEVHHDEQHRQHREEDKGRLPAQPEHHREERGRLQEIRDEGEGVPGEALAKGLHVARHPGEDRADRVAVEVAPGEAEGSPVDRFAERAQQFVTGALQDAHVEGVREVPGHDHPRGESDEREQGLAKGAELSRGDGGQQIVVHRDLRQIRHQGRHPRRHRKQGEHRREAPAVPEEVGAHRGDDRRRISVAGEAPPLGRQAREEGERAHHRIASSSVCRRHASR